MTHFKSTNSIFMKDGERESKTRVPQTIRVFFSSALKKDGTAIFTAGAKQNTPENTGGQAARGTQSGYKIRFPTGCHSNRSPDLSNHSDGALTTLMTPDDSQQVTVRCKSFNNMDLQNADGADDEIEENPQLTNWVN